MAVITKNWKLIFKLAYCQIPIGLIENHFKLQYFIFSNYTILISPGHANDVSVQTGHIENWTKMTAEDD